MRRTCVSMSTKATLSFPPTLRRLASCSRCAVHQIVRCSWQKVVIARYLAPTAVPPFLRLSILQCRNTVCPN